ncbi:MAG: uracil-DNA glycosylase [Microbacteriaceae bacterium]|nr:uracil-DNA glycosylase [Microbacteriaceae bacterium]
MFFEQMHPTWQQKLAHWSDELEKISERLAGVEIVPAQQKVMRVFEKPIDHHRVLIVGQDPYPNPEHACGLAFAVEGEVSTPASLRNILTELRSDLGRSAVKKGDISAWQDQGVMLLNRSLSTLSGESNQHAEIWDGFTQDAVKVLADAGPLVAVLWGRQAQQLAPLLADATVISSAHPSPLSSYRGFFDSKPFSKVNQALIRLGEQPIDWTC